MILWCQDLEIKDVNIDKFDAKYTTTHVHVGGGIINKKNILRFETVINFSL